MVGQRAVTIPNQQISPNTVLDGIGTPIVPIRSHHEIAPASIKTQDTPRMH